MLTRMYSLPMRMMTRTTNRHLFVSSRLSFNWMVLRTKSKKSKH